MRYEKNHWPNTLMVFYTEDSYADLVRGAGPILAISNQC